MAKRKKKLLGKVLITGIADKGRAVGRSEEGEVVFVEEAVPGDVVEVLVLRKKKSVNEGVVTRYISYSEERTVPVCQHFGVCGGCKWQHLDYSAQLRYKEQTVRDCIQRLAKMDGNLVLPILGCGQNYQYRNKLEYSFSTKRWITREEAASDEELMQQGALGFHRPGYFDKIVPIEICHLQDDVSNQIRNFIRDYTQARQISYYDLRSHQGLMRNMIVRNTTLGEWMLIVVFGYRDEDVIEALMAAVHQAFPQITSLNYVINDKSNDTIFDKEVVTWYGQPYITEKLRDVAYRIGPKSFFQTNPRQAVTLFDVATDFACLQKTDNVYDLYTGLGSIALYIAGQVDKVTGIEEIPEAIDDANLNRDLNHIENAVFYAGDVKHLLNDSFVEKHGKADVIITDPPRQGMHENVVQTLLALEVPRLIYISCNPATMARDLALLADRYETLKVQPVDMFPHTHHIECVAQLKRKATT